MVTKSKSKKSKKRKSTSTPDRFSFVAEPVNAKYIRKHDKKKSHREILNGAIDHVRRCPKV